MRMFLGLALVAVMGLAAGADDKKDAKIDGKKLVGKWTPESAPKDVNAVVEFTKDGKMNVTMVGGGKNETITGTYKLTGNKLSLNMKREDKEKSVDITVTKLTDDVFEGEGPDGKKEAFKRVKDAPKKDKR